MAKSALSRSVDLYNKSQKALMMTKKKKWPPCNKVHLTSCSVAAESCRLTHRSHYLSALHSHKSLHSPQSLKLVKPVKEKMYRTQTHVTVQVSNSISSVSVVKSLQISHMLKEQPKIHLEHFSHTQVKIS